MNTSQHAPLVILLAAGAGLRWQASAKRRQQDGSHEDVTVVVKNKLLIDIRGKPLLWRTLDRLTRAGIVNPIVFGKEMELPHGTARFFPQPAPTEVIRALDACRPLWNGSHDILFMLGDVAWSTAAVAQLLAPTSMSWCFFGKLSGNAFTGKPWPEVYALRAEREAMEMIVSAAQRLDASVVWRKKFWELYRVLLAKPCPMEKPDRGYLFHPPSSDHFQVIPDWTDDVDDLNEYLRLQQLLNSHPELD